MGGDGGGKGVVVVVVGLTSVAGVLWVGRSRVEVMLLCLMAGARMVVVKEMGERKTY